jgi:hypothetical protein
MRNKFIFLSNFKDAADKLPDDMRLKFYDAMTDYVFKGIDPDDAVVAALVGAIKPSLDIEDKRGGMREGAGRKSKEIKNNQKNQNDYFEKIENQKKSNEIKNNQNDQKEKKTPLNPEKNKNIYIPENNKLFSAPSNDDDTIDLEELIAKTPPKPKSKSFTPPTLEDVKAYIAERDCAAVVDARKFFDYFEAGHWHDSEGKPVRNWKQKLITWETHGRQTRTLKAAQGLLGVKSGTYAEDVPL